MYTQRNKPIKNKSHSTTKTCTSKIETYGKGDMKHLQPGECEGRESPHAVLLVFPGLSVLLQIDLPVHHVHHEPSLCPLLLQGLSMVECFDVLILIHSFQDQVKKKCLQANLCTFSVEVKVSNFCKHISINWTKSGIYSMYLDSVGTDCKSVEDMVYS